MFGAPFHPSRHRMKTFLAVGFAGIVIVSTSGCATSNAVAVSQRMNELSAAERQEGWKLLFDGATTNGWRNYRKQTVSPGWTVVNGLLTRSGENAGDIITDEQYRNFDLVLDWRIAEGGNSGIFYRATQEGDYIWQSAPEMQILDDARHADGKLAVTSAGSNFALIEAPRGIVHPAGQWNTARLVVLGNHVEHWLNGRKLFEYQLGSDDWRELVAKSKFNTMPLYGKASEGYIGLQDHGDKVEFRNIRIKVLP
jgi:hypothetical protein